MCIQEIKNYEPTIKKIALDTVQSTSTQSNQIHEKVVASLEKDEFSYLKEKMYYYQHVKNNFIII